MAQGRLAIQPRKLDFNSLHSGQKQGARYIACAWNPGSGEE